MYLGSSRGFRGVAEGPFEAGFRSYFWDLHSLKDRHLLEESRSFR